MASFDVNKNGSYTIRFRFQGKPYKRSLKLGDQEKARWVCDQVEDTLTAVETGQLVIPYGADVCSFLISGGKIGRKLTRHNELPEPIPSEMGDPTLKWVFDIYEAKLTEGTKERTTRITEAIHERHLIRILGGDLPFREIKLAVVQIYVDIRASEGVSRTTIRKEIDTLRLIAEWAYRREMTKGRSLWRMSDLTLPKSHQKPGFQTWDQIARQIERGRLDVEQQRKLWDSLWLSEEQVVEFLDWASNHPKYPWMYPILAIAAYTGARRSEILRSEIDDWDFDSGQAFLRQKKSDRSMSITQRFVPINPDLTVILQDWIDKHPGGPLLICSVNGRPIRAVKASDSFRIAVKGTKWEVVRGYHMLRHSLASNMAIKGVDQRVIDELLGHSTTEMSRRYRHLGPNQKQAAVAAVFGEGRLRADGSRAADSSRTTETTQESDSEKSAQVEVGPREKAATPRPSRRTNMSDRRTKDGEQGSSGPAIPQSKRIDAKLAGRTEQDLSGHPSRETSQPTSASQTNQPQPFKKRPGLMERSEWWTRRS